MKNKLVLLLCIISLQFIVAQQSEEKFSLEMDYLVYKPNTYNENPDEKWPLVIFLHGAGERGSDLEKVKKHGPPMLVENGKNFPFILISPQAKKGWNAQFLYKMIVNFIENNKVDKDRVYLTGLSMGGYGTWKLAQEHPELFAAIAPICGGGNIKDIWKLRNMPVWCFHGKKDEVVPITASQTMVDALKVYNPSVKFTVYPDVYHDSWVKAYNNSKLYEWLLSHKKHRFKAISLSEETLSKYTGNFSYKMNNEEGVLKVLIEDDKLVIDSKSRKTTLIPFAENKFFIKEDQPIEFHFLKNKSGKVDSIQLFTQEISTFQKIE